MATTTHDLKLRALLDVSQVKQQVQQLNSKNTVNLDASGISHSINLLNQTISKFTNSLEKLSQHTQQAAVKINNASNQSFTLGRLGEIGKVVAGIAVERAGGSAKNYFDATGNVAAANTSDFLSKFGRGALAGSAGGWIGAAIGGGFGALEFAFDKLADNAKKAAEELEAYNKTLADARATDQAILARENTEKFNQLLATGTKQQLEAETYWRKLSIADADATKQAFRSQFGDNAIETATKRISSLQEQYDSIDESYIYPRKRISNEIAQIQSGIESYKKAEEERVKYTNELKQLNIAIAQRKTAEEQVAKAAEAKAEIERKAAEAEYNKYLEAGDGEKATEARRQLMRYRGYESSITSGIEGLKSKNISKLGEQYSSLLNDLQQQLQPATPVSELQAQGFGMGWVDPPVNSIQDNVSKIANKMIELIGLIRNTEQDVGSTLW